MRDDDRVSALLGDWLDQRERGEAADPEDVIRAHPDLAVDLRKGFRALECVELLFQDRSEETRPVPAQIGAYRVDRELGAGGMGTVYRAVGKDEAPVALKVVHPHLLRQGGFFKRFLREAEIGTRVVHENVVRTFDVDAVEADAELVHYLVMEYVEGQTLRELVDELETVPEELCRHIGREVARGLSAIHDAGVVHRDVKPENVLITKDHQVKIMDLGVARLQDEAIRLSQTGHFVGSIHYAAPEQFRSGGADVDGRADLHALGVILYELACGLQPFHDEDARVVLRRVLDETPRALGEVNPQVSPFFEEVVRTLLAKEREKRFDGAATLLEILEGGEESGWWKERAQALRIQTKRPLRRIRVPRETALYGRDDDIAKLRAAYEQAKEGEGQVLLIEGEAGIGKTRLADEFVGLLQREGEDLNFLFGSYPPGGAATTAGAFSTAYREQFGEEGLDETLKEYLPVTPLLVPAFSALLRGEPTPEGKESLTKSSLQTVFVHATRTLAAERPTIVLIEDLHFAPEEGRALFAALALAVPGHRILLVGTMRPGVPESWTASLDRLDQASKLDLARLGAKDLARLLKDAFRSDRLAEQLALRIAEKSDGNPFFVFEIIRGLKEGQFLTQRPDGTWVTTQVIRDFEVPSSVLDLVNARVADLEEEERTLLDVAACCGFHFDPILVAAAAGLPPVPTLQRLGRIEKRHRLVRSAGRDYTFDHHQVQEALYGALNERLREHYHAALGEALERRHESDHTDPKDLDGAVAVELSEHFLRGRKAERARPYLNGALAHLEAGYQNEKAVDLADRALAVDGLLVGHERIDMLIRSDKWLARLGRPQERRRKLEEALELARKESDREREARAERALGMHLFATEGPSAGHDHLARSATRAREIGDAGLEGAALNDLVSEDLDACRWNEARSKLHRGLHLAQVCASRNLEAAILGNMGTLCLRLKQIEKAIGFFERAVQIDQSTGVRRGEVSRVTNLGICYAQLRRNEEAREQLERALEIAHRIGDRQEQPPMREWLGILSVSVGDLEDARTQYELGLEIARDIGNPRYEGTLQYGLGYVLHQLGRLGDAQTHALGALDISRRARIPALQGWAWTELGRVYMDLGRPEKARSHLQRGLEVARRTAMPSEEADAMSSLGELWMRLGHPRRARPHFEGALSIWLESGDPYSEGCGLVQVAAERRESGDLSTSLAYLDRAEALIPQAADPSNLLALRIQRARLPAADPEGLLAGLAQYEAGSVLGTRMEARLQLWKLTEDHAHLEEAHRLLEYLVEHAPEEYRESMIENVPLHRDIARAWEEHGG